MILATDSLKRGDGGAPDRASKHRTTSDSQWTIVVSGATGLLEQGNQRGGMKPAKLWGCIVGALAVALICRPAQGAEGYGDWTEITEDETKLIFDAPGVKDGARRFYKRTMRIEPHYQEFGIWVGPSGLYPRARIFITELASYYYYGDKRDLKDTVRRMLKDKEISFGKENTSENVIGDISYLKYSSELGQCVAFSQYWGQVEAETASGEDSAADLFGHYCVGAEDSLSAETVAAVLKGIGMKGEAVPKR